MIWVLWCPLVLKPKAVFMKEMMDNLDFIKIKNFFSMKANVKRSSRQVTDW